MQKLYNGNLTELDKKIAEIIINCNDFQNVTIYQLADAAYVSPSKITKYCQNIGFSGFKELKYYILDNKPNYSLDTSMFTLEKNNILNLLQTKETIFVDEVIRLFNTYTNIVMFCTGPTYGITKIYANQMRQLSGKNILVTNDSIILKSYLDLHPSCVIFISVSGKLTHNIKGDALRNAHFLCRIACDKDTDVSAKFNLDISLTGKSPVYEDHIIRSRALLFTFLELVALKYQDLLSSQE